MSISPIRSPLVTFTGSTPSIGTTTAALAAAWRIAERSSLPVAYLCLNLKSSKLHRYLRVDKPAITLDSLRPELKAGLLTPEKLRQAVFRPAAAPNLNILFGSMMRDQAEFFSPEEIRHLLETARTVFGLIVADVNAYWDNAATVTALLEADSRILVTTTALSHFQEDTRRWLGQSSPLFGIPSEAYETVVVRPPWRNGGYTMKDIEKESGLAAIGELKLAEPFYAHLDSGSMEEWLGRHEQGKRAMQETADKLMNRHSVRLGSHIKRQPWYRKLLDHRNGVGS
ncbi:P-loop NTPase family protein [Paenibacillus tarimensis]|uniref:hypothetical protein n=1 Tax=Paenibacillus tarimensis TaxID=416012 RepID=UPI001F16A068|nr:hypothetical protein [Paenibacillus tarimensis]MCF2945935.1 hypothetical protein [Paenibacillus tarimensis]